MRNSDRSLTSRVDRWLDYVLFAGMELTVLVLPVLWWFLVAAHPEKVSLSAMTTLTVGSAAIGTLRGGYVGGGAWPTPGHLATLPIRSAYYSAVLGAATFVGVQAQLAAGSPWPGVGVPAAVVALALVPFPRLLAGLEAVARVEM